MSIDRKTLETERDYVHKLLGYIDKKLEINLDKHTVEKDNAHIIFKDQNIISLLKKHENTYLMLRNKRINIRSNKKYSINLKGEIQGDIDVKLYITVHTYNHEQIEQYTILINQPQEIQFQSDSTYVTCQLSIANEGIIKNGKIQIQAIGEIQKPEQSAALGSMKELHEEIDVEDYKINSVYNLNEISSDIFYVASDEIKIDKIIQVSIPEGAKYISLYEQNVDFNKLPNEYPIQINSRHTYYLTFKGQVDIGLKAQLFAVLYTQKGKEEVYQVGLNQVNTISPSPYIKSMRLAIRVEGQGNLEIHNICIESKRKIEFIGYANLKKLGFDIPNNLSELKLACIFDEFTTECYKHSCKLIPITPYDWKAKFTIEKPHILMVESAWVGNNGAWARKVAYTNDNSNKELKELVEWCKINQIPTIFWNKEDPVHYHLFINTAKMFDYIFTTDENKITDYKRDTGNTNVYGLPFAAQPSIHNPIKIMEERNSKACFAGSYYASKYPERQEDINRLLDAAVDTIGIEIYDRHFGTVDEDFLFPERFRSHIKGNLKPNELHIANKGYKVMVNVNSVKESPTMFSRRVFEGLACGTPVVSSYSEGINALFEDITVASDDIEVLREEFNKLSTDQNYYYAKQLRGIREVLEKHTYSQRLKFILDKVGINLEITNPLVNVIIEIHNEQEVDKALTVYNQQSYLEKKLTLVIDGDSEQYYNKINDLQVADIEVINLEYYCKNNMVVGKYLSGDFYAFMNLHDGYGMHYLKDLVLACQYAKADVIGKASYYVGLETVYDEQKQYVYVNALERDCSLITPQIMGEYTYMEIKALLDGKSNGLYERGYRLFSIDKYNYYKVDDGQAYCIDHILM